MDKLKNLEDFPPMLLVDPEALTVQVKILLQLVKEHKLSPEQLVEINKSMAKLLIGRTVIPLTVDEAREAYGKAETTQTFERWMQSRGYKLILDITPR